MSWRYRKYRWPLHGQVVAEAVRKKALDGALRNTKEGEFGKEEAREAEGREP